MTKGIEFLKSILVKDFPQVDKNDGNVVVLQDTDTLKDAMKTLTKHNIYSAPVFSKSEDQHLGMFDMIDVVHFIAENYDAVDMASPGFEAEFEQAERLAKAHVADVVDFSKRNPFVPVPDDASLFTITEVLADFDVHRVNVFDSDGKLANVITQSALVNALAQNIGKVADIAGLSVADVGNQQVQSVDISAPTIDAFRLLYQWGFYAVPVVNQLNDSSIVTNISAKDVRLLCESPAKLQLLHAPISQFLATLHEDDLNIRTPSITAKPTDTVADVMKKLALNRIHRVYLLNDNNSVKSVISLTDILRLVIHPPSCVEK